MFSVGCSYTNSDHSLNMNENLKEHSETKNKNNIVKLYLKKNENDDIFVEGELQQHHIEGIRFLYRQYQKKNSGVIINAPENSLLVALLIGAIKKTLNKPILIVTDDNNQYDWLDYFQKHTNCYNDVVAAASSLRIDGQMGDHKSIYIMRWNGSHGMFSHRDWSIVVVDTDNFILDHRNKQLEKTDFKIWLPLVDVESKSFSDLYQWLHPKENFIEANIPKKSTLKDVLAKVIERETFLEDTLFKFSDIHDTLNGREKRKLSFKNKDATGTKIKRSKKVLNDVTPPNKSNSDDRPSRSEFKDENVRQTNLIDNNSFSVGNYNKSKISSDNVSINTSDKQCDEDIESFIRNKEPINDAFNDYSIGSDSNSDIEVPKAKKKRNIIPIDTDSDSAYELETQEIVQQNSNEAISVNKDNETCNQRHISDTRDTEKPLQDENKNSVFNKQEYFVPNGNDNKKNMSVRFENKTCATNNDKTISPHSDPIEAEVITKTNEIKNINGNGTTNEDTNGIDWELDEVIKTEESQIVLKGDKHLDIDSKISDHEDRILKKFKGSFLDSIF